MSWNELYPKITPPIFSQVAAHISSPLWDELCTHLETSYGVAPKIEHSGCGGAPGWNVKYKKSSRALCTLYPAEGYFTALVSVGSREAMEAELLLAICTEYTRDLYWRVKPYNGSRWMMIEVRTPEILEDVNRLIALRLPNKPSK